MDGSMGWTTLQPVHHPLRPDPLSRSKHKVAFTSLELVGRMRTRGPGPVRPELGFPSQPLAPAARRLCPATGNFHAGRGSWRREDEENEGGYMCVMVWRRGGVPLRSPFIFVFPLLCSTWRACLLATPSSQSFPDLQRIPPPLLQY